MRNLIKKSIAFLAAGLLAVAVSAGNVYADDQVFSSDSAGNWFGAGQLVDTFSYAGTVIDNELFVAGLDVRADNVDVDGSVFIAGNDVSVIDSTVGGSIFAAGQNVTVDAKANNNIWAAGNNLSFKENTSVKGLQAAGASAIVNGEYEAVSVAAGTVIFNAKVDGDVTIDADNVTIGDDAEIGGLLKITSKNEPKIADGAYAGDYEYEQVTEDSSDNDSDSSDSSVKEGLFAGAGTATAGLVFLKKVTRAIKNLFRFALFAVILSLVFKKNLNDSVEYATKKSGAFWGFGALALIFFPLAAIILCVTIVGLPIALLSTGFYVMGLMFAYVFTFASLVRELIFTHTSKRLNPMLETVLAVLPAAIIKEIPIIGGIIGFACAIYTIGYIVLAIADTISANKTPKAVKVETATADTVANAEAAAADTATEADVVDGVEVEADTAEE